MAWRRWVERELASCPVAAELGEDRAYDRARDGAHRERLGQVFTPPQLAQSLARLMHAERPGSVLDPACGDGSLLLAVADLRLSKGQTAGQILEQLRGWDIDPMAAWLCRMALLEWGLRNANGHAPSALRIECRDLFGPGMAADMVICNPPYLEAKRMGRAQPGLKERLKRQFPQLVGAFDLYIAVAYRARELAPVVGLLVPNKVCQARYARRFRETFVHELAGLLDLARLSPRPFPGSSVYPVLLHLEQGAKRRSARVRTRQELAKPAWQPDIDLTVVEGEAPWFVPFSTWTHLEPLFELPRLGELATVVSTCSFHKKGLRERFVTQTPGGLPYLGGPSRARQTEVAPFRERWSGWFVDYDQDTLGELGNKLPPLSNFQRPKVIFNQHDRRMTAWADLDGRFVTKDVYPIAWPDRGDWSVEALTVVFNSSVFSALYNTVYQGILVGGETYHYLPAFLKIMPMPVRAVLGPVDAEVRALQQDFDAALWTKLDRRVTDAYGLDESARQMLVRVHLKRVKAPHPG